MRKHTENISNTEAQKWMTINSRKWFKYKSSCAYLEEAKKQEKKRERSDSPVGAPFIICVNWMPAWSWEHLLINIQDRVEDAEGCWMTETASKWTSAWLCCRTFTSLQQLGRCVCKSGNWFIRQDEVNEWIAGHQETVGSMSTKHWLNQPLRHKQPFWVTQ